MITNIIIQKYYMETISKSKYRIFGLLEEVYSTDNQAKSLTDLGNSAVITNRLYINISHY